MLFKVFPSEHRGTYHSGLKSLLAIPTYSNLYFFHEKHRPFTDPNLSLLIIVNSERLERTSICILHDVGVATLLKLV